MGERKPEVRFEGFDGEWERRKLGDVFEEYSEKNHEELPALTIIQGKGTILREESDRNLQYDKASLSGYKLVRKDDFIVHLRSFEGGLEKANCDGIVSPAYHMFHGKDTDTRFYYPYFRSYEFVRRKLVPHIYGIRDGKSIDIAGLKTIKIPYPSIEEQRRIGDYIESLDNLIILYERKCDALKEAKKFYLQNMFPQKGENAPRIRFEGFAGDWEQRKFPEFVEFYNGLTYTPGDVQESGTLVLRSSNVKNGEIVDADNVYVNPEIATSENVRKGDIIVVVRNGSRALIGKHAEIKESMPNTVIGAFMTGIRSEHSSFVNALLGTAQFEKEIEKNMGATINQITGYMFSKMEFMTPGDEEQEAIGKYFKELDNLITLHQRKSDALKEAKKFYLQNMFPQKGEKVPRIRFEGFTGDWEQRKLGEICERVTRKNKNGESDLPLTIASQYGLIDQRDFFNKVVAAKDMSNYYLLKKGEFAYNKSYSNGYDYGSIKRLNAYEKGCLSTLYICFGITSDDIESDYLECFFDTLKWYSDITMICAEGARNHGLLNVDTKAFFDEVSIEMPSSKEEQRKISSYLNNLDNLITLHQV